jgi:putative heme iron utilization protein
LSDDQHARPASDTEPPLYDPDLPAPTHAERARTLVASIATGTLCTIAKEPSGFPYGSFVTFATEASDPVFFISTLAEHTKNLRDDPRASLLVAEGGAEDPLANGRVTLLGRCRTIQCDDERDRAKAAYLAVHPNAEYYVEFKDFAFWRLDVESVRYIGGYGRMSWVTLGDWSAAEPDPIAPHARAIIEHMNADHGTALVSYCRAFSKADDVTAAVMTAVDRYGFEMSANTGRGPRPIRVAFSEPITGPGDARRQMVELAKKAREILAQ